MDFQPLTPLVCHQDVLPLLLGLASQEGCTEALLEITETAPRLQNNDFRIEE